ncbi:MAG: magnesium/cobalt transporter CorA, partial [Methylobacter sp.]
MSKLQRHVSTKSGLPPGSLVHVGEVHDHEHRISVVSYNDSTIERHIVKSIKEILPLKSPDTVTWVIIDGLKNVSI